MLMYKDKNKKQNVKRNPLSTITILHIKFHLETETKSMIDKFLLIYIFNACHVLLYRLCFEFWSLFLLQRLQVCVSGTGWPTLIGHTLQHIGINNTHFTLPGTPFGPQANYS